MDASSVKSERIIIDIGVPSNASLDLQQRKDITYIKGGMAKLPMVNEEQQILDSVILPFSKGMSYAGLAETIGLSFESNLEDLNTTGNLDLETVQ